MCADFNVSCAVFLMHCDHPGPCFKVVALVPATPSVAPEAEIDDPVAETTTKIVAVVVPDKQGTDLGRCL